MTYRLGANGYALGANGYTIAPLSSVTVYESFEDSDISDYTAINGTLGDWGFNSSDATDGSVSVENTNADTSFYRFAKTTGGPGRGQDNAVDVKLTAEDTVYGYYYFSWTDASNNLFLRMEYEGVDGSGSDLSLYETVSGTEARLDLDANVASYPQDDWVTAEITDDGTNISVDFVHSGSTISTLTGTNSTVTGSGIAFGSLGRGTAGPHGTQFDYVRSL